MKKLFYLSICALLLSSCGVRYKSVPYFQDLADSGMVEEKIHNYTALKIQRDDVLAITITSLNPEASSIFNMGNTSSSESGANAGINPTANGFKVDQNGQIQLPIVGSVTVVGLTSSEARDLLLVKLTPFLKEPVVSLRFVNLRISVLGDVANPGVYPVQNERVSLPEALGMAGDLTITAQRDNVLLVREVDGRRQYVRLNLHKKDLFNSPYYYLQNNDVVYVQPSNAKYASVDSSYRNVSVILSALSVIVLIITRF